MATQNKFPLGWNEQQVRQTIEYYDRLSEDEAVAEDSVCQVAERKLGCILCLQS